MLSTLWGILFGTFIFFSYGVAIVAIIKKKLVAISVLGVIVLKIAALSLIWKLLESPSFNALYFAFGLVSALFLAAIGTKLLRLF